MVSGVGDTVHPWYKGIHEWKVSKVAVLHEPIEWDDDVHGHVEYDPRILKLESPSIGAVLWFNYWMSTDKTQGKMAYGGGPPILEEDILLELIKDAIQKGIFDIQFLTRLRQAIRTKPSIERPNMDRQEFKRQLDELMKIVCDITAYLAIWRDLNVADNETAAALNRYRGLFLTARNASLNAGLMQLAKVFDSDPRTISLRNLLIAAKSNMADYVPHVTENDLMGIEATIDSSANLLERLKTYRDKRLAHHDSIVTDDMHLLYGEVRELVENVQCMYGVLHKGHNNGMISFDRLAKDAQRHTSKVVEIMLEEKNKALEVIKDLEKQNM